MQMKIQILFSLFWMLSIHAFGQDQQKTDLVDSLIWHHYDNRFAESEATIQNLRQLAHESQSNNYYWGETKSLQMIGEVYHILGNQDSCMHYISQSIKLSEQNDDYKQIAISQSLLGRQEQNLGNYPNAVQHFETSLKMSKSIKDTVNAAWAHYDIGWVHMLADDLDSAMIHSIYSMNFAEAIKDTQILGGTYNTVGTIHKKLGNYDKSEEFYLKCIKIYEENSKFEHSLIGAYNNLGILYRTREKYDRAMEYYEKTEAVARKYQNERALTTVWINKGSLLNDLKEYKKAQKNLVAATDLARKLNIPISLADATNNLAKTYIAQNKTDLAEPLLKEAIALSTSVGSWEKEMEAQKTATTYYQNKGNTTAAIQSMERVIALKDSLFQKDMAAQVNTLQQKYESAKQEATIQRLDAERNALNARQQLMKFGGLALLLLGGALFYAFYQRQQKEKLRLTTEKQIAIESQRNARLQLEIKSKELTTNILQLAEKNKLLFAYRTELIQISKLSNKEPKLLTDRLVRRVDLAIEDNQMWTRLTDEFKVVHGDFLNLLGSENTSFSKAEIRLIALLKMNLSSKDIAQILHISAEGVKKARQRLRKKLALDSPQNLQEYILNN